MAILEERLVRAAEILARVNGRQAALYRAHALLGPDREVVSVLRAGATVSAGSSTLDLIFQGTGLLTGHVPAGLVLTIGAHTYALAADAKVQANHLMVVLVSPLLAAVPINTVVQLAERAVLPITGARKKNRRLGRVPAEFEGRVSYRLTFPKSRLSVKPDTDWFAECDGDSGAVLQCRESAAEYALLVGAA